MDSKKPRVHSCCPQTQPVRKGKPYLSESGKKTNRLFRIKSRSFVRCTEESVKKTKHVLCTCKHFSFFALLSSPLLTISKQHIFAGQHTLFFCIVILFLLFLVKCVLSIHITESSSYVISVKCVLLFCTLKLTTISGK